MSQQYDVSPEVRKLFEIKQKQRAAAKEYFQKLLYNPHRPPNDGIPFDPAIMRFNALNNYRYYLYDTTPKFYFKLICAVLPISLIYWSIHHSHKEKEKYFRSGLVKYEDRVNKFFF